MVHVDSDSHGHKMNLVLLRIHFRQDSAEFLASEKKIVRPAQVGGKAGLLQNGVTNGQARDQGDQRRVLRRNGRTQKHGHVDAVGFFRMPGMTGAAAPGGLFLGDHEGAVRFALFSQLHGDGIGGINLEKMVDAFSEWPWRQPLAKNLRREDVGNFLDLIAAARMSLHANAQGAKFLDPAPHGGARHADFAGNFRRR